MLIEKDVLVIAPHPDDETLGAGGTLLRLQAEGARLHWLLMTSAVGAGYTDDYLSRQERQIEEVRKAFSFESFHWLRHPASGLYRADRGTIIDAIRKILNEIKPRTLFVPHAGDAHDDHSMTQHCALAACKSFYMHKQGISRILAMEIMSETDASPPTHDNAFLPTIAVDIGKYLNMKLKILSLYKTELQDNGPRSLKAVEFQARLHGASFGVTAVERFMLIRELIV